MDKQIKEYMVAGRKNLIMIYILYLCCIVQPIFPLLGVIFSYINKDNANQVHSSHYTFLVRTFWLGLIGYGLLKLVPFIGTGVFYYFIYFPLFSCLTVWFIIRIVLGFRALLNNQAHPNPMTLWIK